MYFPFANAAINDIQFPLKPYVYGAFPNNLQKKNRIKLKNEN